MSGCQSKGLFTWREGTPANRAILTLREPTFHVSLEDALKRLHARQGNLSSWGTLYICSRHPSRQAILLPCKQFARANPAS